jgi:MarR family transcriptional regulator, organic hydroperoxide resistance regulator
VGPRRRSSSPAPLSSTGPRSTTSAPVASGKPGRRSTPKPTGEIRANRVDWLSDLVRLEIVLWGRVDGRLRERHGLPLAFFESLYFISRATEGSLRIGDLASALGITVGGTSKVVDRIEAAGLIARGADPDDRRAALVMLTAEGKAALKAALKTYADEVAAFVDPVLETREQEQMHAYITRLLTAARDGATR